MLRDGKWFRDMDEFAQMLRRYERAGEPEVAGHLVDKLEALLMGEDMQTEPLRTEFHNLRQLKAAACFVRTDTQRDALAAVISEATVRVATEIVKAYAATFTEPRGEPR